MTTYSNSYNATTQLLVLNHGDSFSLSIIRQNSDGSRINVTGYTYEFKARSSRSDTAVLDSASNVTASITSAANGVVNVSATAETIEALTAPDEGEFAWVETSTGNPSITQTILRGTFVIRASATR